MNEKVNETYKTFRRRLGCSVFVLFCFVLFNSYVLTRQVIIFARTKNMLIQYENINMSLLNEIAQELNNMRKSEVYLCPVNNYL